MDDIDQGAYDLVTSDPDVCSICGAEPMTALCNNADCWDRVVDNEPTEDDSYED